MGRPKEHDEATRERLLEAAEHLSATQGWDALTVRGIAEEAGTSTRALYALFDSKQGLEQALHEVMFTRLRDLMQGRERSDDPRQDLINLALAYRRWAIERPERYALAMHRFVGQRRRPRSPEGVAVSQAALQELRDAVQRCHDAGLMVDRPRPRGGRDPDAGQRPRPRRVREPRAARSRPRGLLAHRGRGRRSTRTCASSAAAA